MVLPSTSNDSDFSNSYPTKLIVVAAFITVMVMLVMLVHSHRNHETLSEMANKRMAIEQLHGEILRLDESLTLHATLASASGETVWIDRYKKIEVKLDKAIAAILEESTSPAITRYAEDTGDANAELVKLEYQSFDLVHSRESGKARHLLRSTGYLVQKRRYADGMDQLLTEVRRHWDQRITNLDKKNKALLWTIPLLMMAILVLWVLTINKLENWRRALAKNQQLRANAENQLSQVNATLEDRIEIRTQELEKSRHALRQKAYYDELTGLPNRRAGIELLNECLTDARTENRSIVAMIIDLDDFKRVNDSLGHIVGDLLLIEAAERIRQSVRDDDTVVRLGGDEFLVIAPVSNPDDQSIQDAIANADRVLATFCEPFELDNGRYDVTVSPSVGVSVGPLDGEDPPTLLRHTDMAMYRAKQDGRNCCRQFDREMREQGSMRLSIESKLRKAISGNQLSLHYQPQIDLKKEEIVGFEALLRWEIPGQGMVSPVDFIPVAERTGFIIEIGQWVLETACEQLSRIIEQSGQRFSMAVNVSSLQLRQSDFAESVESVLSSHSFAPELLELELTESTLLDDGSIVRDNLKKIKKLGVLLSLDDFGTGYSALGYLKKYHFDYLKIDRSFVDGITDKPEDAALVNAMIQMAHGLRMKVVGEGTETDEQCDVMREFGCDIAQGYFYSKPLPRDQVIEFINNWIDEDLKSVSLSG